MKTIPADMHVHSIFSIDGKDAIDSICRSAVQKGLQYICFSEHYDVNPRDTGFQFLRLKEFSAAIEKARETFGDRLLVLKGLEFGEPHRYPREFEQMAAEDFDVLIAGIHWFGKDFIGDPFLKNRYPTEEIFENYYKEVLKAVNFGGFDILAHFDLPKRYLKTTDESSPLINDILTKMVAKKIALEINTSPLRQGLRECAPGLSIVKKYLALGGSRITLGSDAHNCFDVGAGFADAVKLAEQAEISRLGFYQRRVFKEYHD